MPLAELAKLDTLAGRPSSRIGRNTAPAELTEKNEG